MDWAKTTARGYKKHLSFGIWCDLYKRFYGMFDVTAAIYSQPSFQVQKVQTSAKKNSFWKKLWTKDQNNIGATATRTAEYFTGVFRFVDVLPSLRFISLFSYRHQKIDPHQGYEEHYCDPFHRWLFIGIQIIESVKTTSMCHESTQVLCKK